MQDKYTGDIGDFGKLGLLRSLERTGLSIGVNWYLVPNENNGDGEIVDYPELRNCDEELWNNLHKIAKSEQRCVSQLQQEKILKARFYPDTLDFSGKTKIERAAQREKWHSEALCTLDGCNVVFVDPDNGLIVRSAKDKPKENKYVLHGELADYFENGSSVVYYQHKARKTDGFYIDQHNALADSIGADKNLSVGLKFTKTSQRYFFFLVRPEHHKSVLTAVSNMQNSEWRRCFGVWFPGTKEFV